MGRPKQRANCLPAVIQDNQAVATEARDSREEKFLDLLFVCKSVRDAALQSGYSETYSTANIYQRFKSPDFQQKIIARYKDHCYSDLPLVQKITTQGLKRIYEDLEHGNGDLAAKLKHIPRQVLEITKLLTPESGAGVPMVHIDSLQMIVNGKFNKKADET